MGVRAVYRFSCGVVVSSSWWNSCIYNLNPEVDVGGGGGVQHTLNCGQNLYKHTHTPSL